MPQPVTEDNMTDYAKAQVATEVAFNAMVQQAKDLGMDVLPVAGLMYLPMQKLTYAFQLACRDILLALTPPSSHVKSTAGVDYWAGDSSVLE